MSSVERLSLMLFLPLIMMIPTLLLIGQENKAQQWEVVEIRGTKDAQFDTVRASRFELQDAAGKLRASLAVEKESIANLTLYDLAGNRRLIALVFEDQALFSLIGNGGKQAVTLSVNGSSGAVEIETLPSGGRISLESFMDGPEICLSEVDGKGCAVAVRRNRRKDGLLLLENDEDYVTLQDLKQRVLALETKLADSNSGRVRSQKVPIPIYTDTGVKHSIEDLSRMGAILTLDDGSVWEIFGPDRPISTLWMPLDDVLILREASPVGLFEYQVVNTDESETVAARFIGWK